MEVLDPLMLNALEKVRQISINVLTRATSEFEKERVQDFLNSWDELIRFLPLLVSDKPGDENWTPESLNNALAQNITSVVTAATRIDWEGQPLQKTEVKELYYAMAEVVQGVAQKAAELGKRGLIKRK